MIEFTIIVTLLMTVTCGIVDFSLALQQWNAAAKAAELGGRLAAVSDPISSDIATLDATEVVGPRRGGRVDYQMELVAVGRLVPHAVRRDP